MATRKKTARRAPTHRAPADADAARELVLYIENTVDLSLLGPRGQGQAIAVNLMRKRAKGVYDPALAVKLLEYLTEAGAKRYAKEMGSSEREWSTMFTPATRHEAAKELEETFRQAADAGDYNHLELRRGAHENVAREKAIPYDDTSYLEPDDEPARDERWIVVYDDDAVRLMQNWTGGQSDPLYAISSQNGANYAWVIEDAVSNLDSDIGRVKRLGRNKFQLGKGTFSKKDIDELYTIRDALAAALADAPSGGEVREAGRRSSGRWSLQGRVLHFDGRPFVYIEKEESTRPVEADGAAHLIAELFNKNGVTPDTIYEKHMGAPRRGVRENHRNR